MGPNRGRTRLLALNYHDSCLYLGDVDLLKGAFWLNDSIISFYFQYLEHEIWEDVKERFLFVPPEVTQCIKCSMPDDTRENILEPLGADYKDYMFFALNDNESLERGGGSHWSLVAYSRPENCFFHFDSSSGTNALPARILSDKMREALRVPHARFVEASCLQQNNGYDCGIHVLCTVDYLCQTAMRFDRLDEATNVPYEVISGKRYDLLNIIVDLGGRVD